jgi:hypothetical protein
MTHARIHVTRNLVEEHRHEVTKSQRQNTSGYFSLCLRAFVAHEVISDGIFRNIGM